MRTLALALFLAAACEPLPPTGTGAVPSIQLLRDWLGEAGEPRGGGSRPPDLEVLDRDGRVVGTIRLPR